MYIALAGALLVLVLVGLYYKKNNPAKMGIALLVTAIILTVGGSAFGYWYYWMENKEKPVDEARNAAIVQQARQYCEKDNVAEVYVMDEYIKVVGSLLGAGVTYYPANGGTPIVCPVVGPDSQSADCKRMWQQTEGWTKVCDGKGTPPVNNAVNVEQEIKKLFAQKYNKPVADVNITISKQDATHARGMVSFAGEMGGGIFLAAQVDNQWKLIFDGNGQISCGLVAPYNFPAEMISDCSNP